MRSVRARVGSYLIYKGSLERPVGSLFSCSSPRPSLFPHFPSSLKCSTLKSGD